jgi:hypothetical protein
VTEGRRRLLAVLQVIRAREVASRVRVTHKAVSNWSVGLRKPSKRARAMLEIHVGIEAASWDRGVNRPASRYYR